MQEAGSFHAGGRSSGRSRRAVQNLQLQGAFQLCLLTGWAGCLAGPSGPPHSIPRPSTHANLDLKLTWPKPSSHLPSPPCCSSLGLLPLPPHPQMSSLPTQQGQPEAQGSPFTSNPSAGPGGFDLINIPRPPFWSPPPVLPPRSACEWVYLQPFLSPPTPDICLCPSCAQHLGAQK